MLFTASLSQQNHFDSPGLYFSGDLNLSGEDPSLLLLKKNIAAVP